MCRKVFKVLAVPVDYVSVCALAVMVSLMLVEVLCRYVLRICFPVTDELAMYLMVWVTFLLAGDIVRTEEHITLDILLTVVKSTSARQWIHFGMDILALIVAAIFLVLTTAYLLFNFKAGETLVAAPLPIWMLQSSLVVGPILMIIYFSARVTKHIRGRRC